MGGKGRGVQEIGGCVPQKMECEAQVCEACEVASRTCGDNKAPHSFVNCPRGWLQTRDT